MADAGAGSHAKGPARAPKRPRPAGLAGAYGQRALKRLDQIRVLGQGQFGCVKEYSLKGAKAGRPMRVALKQPLVDPKSGAELGSVKELAALAELSGCRGVVQLVDAVPGPSGQVWLGLERCVGDLSDLICDSGLVLSEANVKALAQALLGGLCEMHERGWMHRDLKPENVLLSVSPGAAELRLADFGHACRLPRPEQAMGHMFATVWYRAPELMMHAPTHDDRVDVWAAGCIIAELFLRRPLFPGEPGGAIGARDEEEGTLSQVFRLLGTPSDDDWPGCKSLPGWREFEHRAAQRMTDVLRGTGASPLACSLIADLLMMDPAKRPSARQALDHVWFRMDPHPTRLGEIPLPTKSTQAAAGILLAERRRAAQAGAAGPAKAGAAAGAEAPQ